MLIQLNLKKYKTLNHVLKKYLEIINQNSYGVIKNHAFLSKEMQNFSKNQRC